jgi:hypothetical protein
MKILAILQNMWVKDPEKVKSMLARDTTGQLRGRIIRYSLFAGCKTGRVLQDVFGEELCTRIIWEEASPIIAADPHDYFPPDAAHVNAALDEHQPDLVVGFTSRGKRVLHSICHKRAIFSIGSIHPAARGPCTRAELVRTRDSLLAHEYLWKNHVELMNFQTEPAESDPS